jgi:hypothetical protein
MGRGMMVGQGSQGHMEVAAIDPIASMQAVSNKGLEGITKDVQKKLKKVIDSL